MRRHLPASLASFTLLVTLVVPLGSTADAATSVEQLRRDRREVQQRRAAQAAGLDALRASDSEVGAALDALEANRRAQAAAVTAARRRAAAEAARAAAARAEQAQTRQELGELKRLVREVAVAEYMRGGKPELTVATDLSAPMETARRKSLASVAVGKNADALDRLRQVEQDLARERAVAEQAAKDAAVEQQRVERRLGDLEAAVAQQAAVAAEVEARLERALAEAQALASLDATLATRITAEQAALARKLRATTPAVPRVAAPVRTRRSVSPEPATSAEPAEGATERATERDDAPRPRPSSSRPAGEGLTSVRGIVVADSLAPGLAALLDAAEADGIVLSGGGYRDSSQQVATRRANCGTSDYDVYEKPASQCRPPTARPGQSMHEQGLAVDFVHRGRILTRSSPAFRWLQANASRFGLYNLPSEPWHWSTNGR